MACKRCGQRKQVSVNVVTDSTNRNNNVRTNTSPQNGGSVSVQRTSNLSANKPLYKTITRNPHHNGNVQWVSDWAYVVVSLDGEVLDPSTFIYACDEGWVDMLDANPMPSYSPNGEVLDVSKQRIKGKVNIVSYAKNDCEDCRAAMKKVTWWDSSYYTHEVAGNIVANQLTPDEREIADKVRAQIWNQRAEQFR